MNSSVRERGFRLPLPDKYLIAIAVGVAMVMIFYQLGLMPLLNPDEGRNASVAWEMQRAGTWLVPTYDGLAYLDKPSFYFKVVAISLSVFGHSELAARLPSALFALGTLLLVFNFCRREYDLRTAALAVAVVSTTPMFFAFARIVIFDATLAFFVCAAIFAGYLAEIAEGAARRRWSMVAVGAMGFAALVKGPIGFIVPILVLAVFNRLDGKRGAMKRLLCWPNLLLFFAIFLPWFIGVSLMRHDFPYYGVIEESVLRFTTKQFHRSQPFYFYPPVIFAGMLAWSLMLPQTLWLAWRQRASSSRPDRLMIVWAIVVTLFFSVSQSKLPGYVLTAVIALSVLLARRLATAFDSDDDVVARTGAFLLALLSGVAAALLFFYLGHFLGIDAKIHVTGAASLVAELHAVAAACAVALSAIAAASLYAGFRRDARVGFLAFVACPVLLLVLLLPALVAGEKATSDAQLATDLRLIAPQRDIACYACFPGGIPFYLGRDVTVFTNANGAEIQSNYIQFSLASPGPWPSQMQRADRLDSWISQRTRPLFLLAQKENVPVLEALAVKRHSHVQEMAGSRYWGLLVSPADAH